MSRTRGSDTPGSNLSQTSWDLYCLPLFCACTEETATPILQMRKLRLREAKVFTQGHTAVHGKTQVAALFSFSQCVARAKWHPLSECPRSYL